MCLLGIDLGGTTIKAGIVNEVGELLVKAQVPTGAADGAAAVLERIGALADELCRRLGITRKGLKGIGIGVPGSVEGEQGLVRLAPNLFWRDFPLVEELSVRLDLPVAVDNDAHAAALGEMWLGAGRGFQSLLMITIGTGIGSALIINGCVWRGFFGYGAEMGHVKMLPDGPPCHCGGRGCLETQASATAMVRRFREYLDDGRPSRLQDHPGLDAREILAAAAGGDELCLQVVDEAAVFLGRALANAVLLAGPEVVILGGGVVQAGEVFLAPIRRHLKEALGGWETRALPVVGAALGNDAGIIGAARLALQLM